MISAARLPAADSPPPATAPRARWQGLSAPARWAAVGIVLLAWGLRLWGIGDLRMFGDSAYSVYLAGQPVFDLLRLTGADSHPPLYYLLLAGWLGLLGPHELTARWLSLAPALVAIPLSFQLGRRLTGDRPAVIAALLLAVSPFAFHYARLPRMYGWVMVAMLVAALALPAAVQTNRRRDWLLYGVAAWAALHLHYYTALGLVALNIWALPAWRRPAVRLSIVRTNIAIGLLFLPWFLFAFLPSAQFTAGNISNAPPPAGLLGFLEQFVIPFAVGVFVDERIARPAAWGLLAALGLLTAWAWLAGRGSTQHSLPHRGRVGEGGWASTPQEAAHGTEPSPAIAREPDRAGNGLGHSATEVGPRPHLLPVLMLVVPLLLALLVFVPFPFFARQRFLLFALPFALLLVGWLVDRALALGRPIGVAALGVLAAAAGLGLGWVVPLERYLLEPDAVQLADAIRRQAGPEDVVYLQAVWQQGYFRLHGAERATRSLRGQAPAGADQALAAGRAVWVAIYGIGDRDPRQPLPAWLDEHAVKVGSAVFGPTHVARYVPRPAAASAAQPRMGPQPLGDGGAIGTLEQFSVLPVDNAAGTVAVRPGGTIAVGLSWLANQPSDGRVAFFLHLDDLQGQTWAGRDGEPQEGLRPTDQWRPGERIADSRGLTVGPHVPPGEYRLVLGAYRADTGAPVPLGGTDAPLVLSGVRVGQADSAGRLPPVAHPSGQRFVGSAELGGAFELAGYDLDLDRPQPIPLGVVDGRLDTPIQLTRFKDSYAPGETATFDLRWRAHGRTDRDYTVFLHVLDAAGTLVAQQDGPPAAGRRPTSSWQEAEIVIDRKSVKLPPDLPPGTYRVVAGLYRPDTGERLKSPPNARGRVQDTASLGTIRVEWPAVAANGG